MKDDIQFFHKNGYLVKENVLNQQEIDALKNDLDNILTEQMGASKAQNSKKIIKRMFERSDANLELFWKEPIVSFAEQLIADNGSQDAESYEQGIPSANETHVIHNNSFKIPPSTKGLGGSRWHQDDTPHLISLDGKPLTNVKLPVLAFTCLYYLTDVLDDSYGPTQVIPGSHLFGKHCKGDITGLENQVVSALGKAGTVVMFNNQVWHRGSTNESGMPRYCTQITYAKRLVGHKYNPFMNYQMPKHVVAKAGDDKRKLRLLGFLNGGAYG